MEEEKIETWKTALMGEAILLGFLGKSLYLEPDKDWLETLIKEDVISEVPFGEAQVETATGFKLLQAWFGKNSSGITEEEFGDLIKDYFYLFIGVGKPLAPVWESVYFSENGLLFQKETLEVREFYARFELQAERKGSEPDDHIGLELSFLAHLATLAMQALEQDRTGEAEKLLQAQREFLTQHPLRWVSAWAKLVQEHAGTDYFKGLSHLAVGTLLAAADLLGIEKPEEKTK